MIIFRYTSYRLLDRDSDACFGGRLGLRLRLRTGLRTGRIGRTLAAITLTTGERRGRSFLCLF